MKKNSTTWYLTCDKFRDMTYIANIGIKLDFRWQITHAEFAKDVVHLHNIEW
jgi:hypothetical protein